MKVPKHAAFIIGGSKQFAAANNISIEDAYSRKFEAVQAMIEHCISRNIPAMTFLLLPKKIEEYNQHPAVTSALASFLESLASSPVLDANQVRVSVFGHWYSLPGRLVDAVKRVVDSTKDYDSFFLNLCINYDGRQELLDAVSILCRLVKQGKLDPELVTHEHIRENLYTANVPPPDILVKTGAGRKLEGFLLWDSAEAHTVITCRPFQDLTAEVFDEMLAEWAEK